MIFTLLLLLTGPQDNTINLKVSQQGYSSEVFKLAEKVKLMSLDKVPTILEFPTLTLVQVWSTCCGADPQSWSEARALEETYASLGLNTVSINFENGELLPEQIEKVKAFLSSNPRPSQILLDPLGYTPDILKVKGFPSYVLVTKNEEVVFYTSGKDLEGMSLLRQEIERRITQ